MYAELMKKLKENSLRKITWSEMGKQNVRAKEVNFLVFACDALTNHAQVAQKARI